MPSPVFYAEIYDNFHITDSTKESIRYRSIPSRLHGHDLVTLVEIAKDPEFIDFAKKHDAVETEAQLAVLCEERKRDISFGADRNRVGGK